MRFKLHTLLLALLLVALFISPVSAVERDKVLHASVAAGLTVVAYEVLDQDWQTTAWAAAAVWVLDEMVYQHLNPHRDSDIGDLAADLLGTFVALVLCEQIITVRF